MHMASFVMTKRIEAPVETVFDVATDLEQAAKHIRGIERIELLTPGPIGKGTRWRETRRMMGREATETLEIVSFDRPHGYTVACDSCGCHFESSFRFMPHECDGATHVSLDVFTQARTWMAKLMSPVGDLMFGKTMRQCMDDDLEDIKRVAEERATAVKQAAR
jgi:uncharacterized membrane protein